MTTETTTSWVPQAAFSSPAGGGRPAVEVVELRKQYPKGAVEAVAGLSFSVEQGELFGLLGPNGAGKTTTIGVLTTRVRPSSGTAKVAGVDVVAHPVLARSLLAVVPQRNNLDRSISVKQNLLFHAAYHGVPKAERERRAAELLSAFGLSERAGQKPDLFSGGQAQRMMIARALMHSPKVLFLDEPTTGLDPAARLFVWDRVRDLRREGTTVVLTTHDMDEAAALCDRVGIVDHGKLLALGTPAELVAQLPTERVLELRVGLGTSQEAEDSAGRPAGEAEVKAALAAIEGVAAVETVADAPPTWGGGPAAAWGGAARGGQAPGAGVGASVGAVTGAGRPSKTTLRLRLSVKGEAVLFVAPAADSLARLGAKLAGVSLGEATLEDVFIHLTGRALR
jgi:ABC-2 type transport system ATP-binding protein